MTFLCCFCHFPAHAFVNLLPHPRHAGGWRQPVSYHANHERRLTSTRPAEVLDGLEEESISTSYKIVAGLDPTWFDRFVVAPLGNAEPIEGQSVQQIVQEGKSVSIEWIEKRKKNSPRIKKSDDSDMGGASVSSDTLADQKVESLSNADVKTDRSAVPIPSRDDLNVTAIDENGTASSLDSTTRDTGRTQCMEKDRDEAGATTIAFDSVGKEREEPSVKDMISADELETSTPPDIRFNASSVKPGARLVPTGQNTDGPATGSPERTAQEPLNEEKETRENVTNAHEQSNATLTSIVVDKVQVNRSEPDATKSNETLESTEKPRIDSASSQLPQTVRTPKDNREEQPRERKSNGKISKQDRMPTNTPKAVSSSDSPSFEQKALERPSNDTTSPSSMKADNIITENNNNESSREKGRSGKEEIADLAMASSQSLSDQKKPVASPLGMGREEDQSRDTKSSTEKTIFFDGTSGNQGEPPGNGKDLNPKVPAKSKANAPSSQESAKGDSTDQVILYRSLNSRPWKRMSLNKLIRLGYTEDDIATLIPDTLELIASESINIPSSGIPQRWKQKNSTQAIVRIMSPEEAEILSSSDTPKQTTKKWSGTETEKTHEPSQRSERMEERVYPGRSERSKTRGQQSDDRRPARRAKRKEPPTVGDRRRRRRERIPTREDGTPKPVYSGWSPMEPITNRQRGDPPSPGTFWPDMDTFRDLLQKEAEFRLGILGDGFADGVRQETMWRYDLYSNWLWTLKNGVGNPIVESRSDRYRRLREQARVEESRDLRKRRERRKRSDE